MQQHRTKTVRARWQRRWQAAGLSTLLSASLIVSAGCGGDDSSTDESPVGTSDAGRDPTGDTRADASIKPDAGRIVDAGLGGIDASASTSRDAAADSSRGSTGLSVEALRGQALAKKNICVSCHQEDYAGAGFYPNITPDKDTGIGNWTDDEIGKAITKGVDDEGEKLCAVMQRYPFSTSELSDLIAFLHSLKPVSGEISAICPGHGD